MDIADEELVSLWRALHEHKVRYILVGGFAVNFHGYSRITADIDLWIEDTLENRKKLRAVLKDIQVGDFKEIETIPFVPGWSSILLPSGFELDIMSYLKKFSPSEFSECHEKAPELLIDKVPVKYLHINHLIEEKETLGRTRDKLDIEELKKLNS